MAPWQESPFPRVNGDGGTSAGLLLIFAKNWVVVVLGIGGGVGGGARRDGKRRDKREKIDSP